MFQVTSVDLYKIADEIGRQSAEAVRRIAAFLTLLQVERPDLFIEDQLVGDWIQRLQAAPIPDEMLPKMPAAPDTKIASLEEVDRAELRAAARRIRSLTNHIEMLIGPENKP